MRQSIKGFHSFIKYTKNKNNLNEQNTTKLYDRMVETFFYNACENTEMLEQYTSKYNKNDKTSKLTTQKRQ